MSSAKSRGENLGSPGPPATMKGYKSVRDHGICLAPAAPGTVCEECHRECHQHRELGRGGRERGRCPSPTATGDAAPSRATPSYHASHRRRAHRLRHRHRRASGVRGDRRAGPGRRGQARGRRGGPGDFRPQRACSIVTSSRAAGVDAASRSRMMEIVRRTFHPRSRTRARAPARSSPSTANRLQPATP
jgi:hypothetical protein